MLPRPRRGWAVAAALLLLVAAAAFRPASARGGLVAHWPLDEDARDVIGGRDGIVVGPVVFGQAGAAAHSGMAAAFDGISTRIDIPWAAELNPPSFTFAVWALAESAGGAYRAAASNRDDVPPGGTRRHGWILYNDNAGEWNFWNGAGPGSNGGWNPLSGGEVVAGEWTHLALTYDAATRTKRIFVNGEQAATATADFSPNNGEQDEDLHLGAGADDGSQFHFEGALDDAALWDEALDAAAIAELMANGVPGGAPRIASFRSDRYQVEAGGGATLTWAVVDAESVTISPGVGSVDPVAGSVTVFPDMTTTWVLTAEGPGGRSTAALTIGVGVDPVAPVISEFVAANRSGLRDGEGDTPDWLEIRNPGPFGVSLDGWSLTDDPSRPGKWRFPAGTELEGGGYLIVFASDKDGATTPLPGGELHANFRLDADGEYLALADPTGAVAQEFAPAYPPAFEDVAFGVGAGGEPGYLVPTPRAPNGPLLTDIGPAITEVTRDPAPPREDEDLVIVARVTPRVGEVASATLHYRIGFGAVVARPMSPGPDGIHTATIPASAYGAGEMVRWFVTAGSAGGAESREPPFLQPTESAEFFGAVVQDPSVGTGLPVLQWFVQNRLAADTRAGTRGSLWFDGRFYDNVFCRIRGQSTAGWPKHKYKFDFHAGGHFHWKDGVEPAEEFNLNSHFRDSYVRENTMFATLNAAGTPTPETFYLWVKRNGEDLGLFSFVEQVDKRFVRRHGFDASGSMYKAINVPATMSPNINASLYRKVLRRDEPYADLQALADGINISNPGRFAFAADHLNLPNYINVMAAMAVPFNHDQLTKNYYLYRDPSRGEWFRFPWDGDQAMPTGDKNTRENWTSPLYGDALHTQELLNGAPNPTWQNHLHAVILDNPVTREMYLRRLRTLADALLAEQPAEPGITLLSGAPGASTARHMVPVDASADTAWFLPGFDDSGWSAGPLGIGFENSPAEYADLIATRVRPQETSLGSTSIYVRIPFEVAAPTSLGSLVLRMKYDDGFVAYLNGTEVARANISGIPRWNSTAAPHLDLEAIRFEDFPLGPAAGRLVAGTNILAIHIANSSAANSDLLLLPELIESTEPAGSFVDRLIIGFRDRIAADATRDQSLWRSAGIVDHNSGIAGLLNTSLPNRRQHLFQTFGPPGSGLVPEPQPEDAALAFGAIEFNPVSGDQDEEFVELVNPNPYAVDLSGWRIEGGIEFTFPPGSVVPARSAADPQRGKVFVSPSVSAFRTRATSPHGGERRIVIGNYAGHLSNFGESLRLVRADGSVAATATYEGNPSDPQRFLVVSEFLAEPPPGHAEAEFIELLNISPEVTIDLGGVRFTRGVDFAFPAGVVLGPGERLVVVHTQAAFEALFGGGHRVAGEFGATSRLDNNGETIKLEDAASGTVAEFTYSDAPPWPVAPDGSGHSLVLMRPTERPEPSDPAHWRLSVGAGGSPGGSDRVPFTSAAGEDADGNGIDDLLDYRLAPIGPSTGDLVEAGATPDGGLRIRFRLRIGADDADAIAEHSGDLRTWIPFPPDGATTTIDPANLGEGIAEVEHVLLPESGAGSAAFVRLRVGQRDAP